MSSTNKTTNYELSQYIGTDKPTYLGDYNGDMLKIDNQMKTNADNASSAYTLANTAKTTADTAEAHAQTAITDSSTAQSTATSALAKATANETAISKFNLSIFENIDNTDIVCPNGTLNNGSTSITVAKNSDGSLAKIYGQIRVDTTNYSGSLPVSFPSSLRPSSDITIQCAVVGRLIDSASDYSNTSVQSLTIRTDGTIEVQGRTTNPTYIRCDYYLLPCLYLIKDFGDSPLPQ